MPTYTSHYNLKKPTPGNHEPFDIEDQNGNMELIDEALWGLPATFKRAITSADDFNAITQDGIYYIQGSSPQNAPPGGITWAYLIVKKVSSSMIHQTIIKPDGGRVVMREYSGTPSSWTSWAVVSGYVAKVRIDYGSNSYVEYWKNGNICQVYVNYKVSDGTLASWSSKTIATLPAGFRPFQETAVRAILDRAGDEGTVAAVNSSGNVVIQTRHNAFDTASDVLQANIVFPVCN